MEEIIGASVAMVTILIYFFSKKEKSTKGSNIRYQISRD